MTEKEYEESKDNFTFKDYFILGNGFEQPKELYKPKKRTIFKVTYIGRYNIYHKGLDVLLNAVKKHADWFIKNNVTFELYGSDSDNGLEYLEKNIKDEKLARIVHINGPVFDLHKEKVLLDSDVFIHTSRLEGQPTAVIEAISYGIPVIVTPGTNIAEEVKKHKLGYTPKLDEDSIFNNIKQAFSNRCDLSSISKNEIRYANKAFDWAAISEKFVSEVIGDRRDKSL